jgi:hypothetical protein
VRYEPAKSPVGIHGCQTGTRALGLAIEAVYPDLITMRGAYGCYNPRRISGSNAWSLHAEGRALDVGVPHHLRDTGWTLACELVSNRVIYGVMRLLWDEHIWSVERGMEWHRMHPTSQQHRDHLHIEQYWRAALRPLEVHDELAAALSADG